MEDDLQSTNSMMVISSTHESYDERQRKRDENATNTWIIILKRTRRDGPVVKLPPIPGPNGIS